MTVRGIRLAALLLALTGLVGLAGDATARSQAIPPPTGSGAGPAAVLPSATILRVVEEGAAVPYDLAKVDPVVVATPDGGAWAFFSASPRVSGGGNDLRVYAARFDPERGDWLPGTALPGKLFQFSPTAVVDAAGRVHVVYADGDSRDAASTLLHVRDDGAGGWTAPVQVAPDPNAGYQLTPVLTRDRIGGIHLLWREQRSASPTLRAKDPNNGDVFASDLLGDAWSPAVQVSRRPGPEADTNAGWPLLAADGDRLIAVWSVYKGTTGEEMEKAVKTEWSSRPLDAPNGWTEPATILDRVGGETGGKLVALAADPRGGAVLAYGRIRENVDPVTNELFLRRLDAAAASWGADVAIGSGDLGYFVAIAIGTDGTVYLTFNAGRNRNEEVGAIVVPPDATTVGPATVLTAGQDGEHGRTDVAVGRDGRPWVVYVHAADGTDPTEIRSLRGPWASDERTRAARGAGGAAQMSSARIPGARGTMPRVAS